MLMFGFHMAFGILLIAFVGGLLLFIKAKKHDSTAGKVFGIIVALLAVGHLVCTSYYGVHLWKQGFYEMPIREMMHEKLENSPAQ